MKKIIAVTLVVFSSLMAGVMSCFAQSELIVLAAPLYEDPYYKAVEEDIIAFHLAYAKKISAHDRVLILTDESHYDRYAQVLGRDKVLIAPMSDIWMRDFSLSNRVNPALFRYSAAGQGGSQADADAVQEEIISLMEAVGIIFSQSDLLNDGGNFVDDYAGNVVISRKFLRDNGLSEAEARDELRALIGVKHVAFIDSDELGGLEHADGVVSFVDTNTVIINAYPDDRAYMKKLKNDLKRGLPNVKIHEITTPHDDSEIYDEAYGSACGLYTNALVTPQRIYFPQFGIAEDKIALAQLRAATSREIIPVASQQICTMGGGVQIGRASCRERVYAPV